MAVEIRVPSLGESVTQAQVGAWLKKEGEAVGVDEPVVEVESEKATVAVPAPSAGILGRILKPQGETVAIGEVIAVIEPGVAQPVPAPAPPASRAAPGPLSPGGAGERANGPLALPGGEGAAPGLRGDATAPPARRLPPSARRRLAEGESLPEPAAARAPEKPPAPPGPRERAVPMTPLRRTVARRLLEAQANAAILTTFNEADMSRVLILKERHGAAFQEKHGLKLGFMSFFAKAAVEALRAFPAVNAEVRGTDIIYKDHYDIGVAVGGGKGLVVPVVRDVDRLSFAEIEARIAELAKRARENRITMDELEGGTFTISNGGIYGSLLSTPILNPPQSGILGLHKIGKRPVVDERDQVVVRPMMYLALSYDHRVVDGREAVSFLVRVKACIEDPERLLLEI
jgi:2-oxoglutarate dehydrogenase E2 component (dihydrolipoamide succinyltransferase)